jgi:predicted DNA-binding transcriptional regulator AlpA
MHDDMERMLGRISVAEMFEISPASVDRYERQGIIPPRRRLSRGRIGWLYSELVEKMRALPIGPLTERTSAARIAPRRKGDDPATA